MFQSINSLKDNITRNPADTVSLGMLADAYRKAGDYGNAISCYEKLVEAQPNNYEALNNYGALLRDTGDSIKSAQIIVKANNILQNNPIILTNLSNTYRDMGMADMAVEQAERAVQIQPSFADAVKALAQSLFVTAEYARSIEIHEKAIKLRPDDTDLLISFARTHYYSGNTETAYQLIKPLLAEKDKGCATVYIEMSKKLGLYDDAVAYIQSILSATKDNPKQPASLYFHLGKYYDNKGAYDKAYAYYQKGNKLADRTCNIKEIEKEFKRIATLYSKANNKRSEHSSITSNQPVFIVGMPRTGTTLVEQILASHPQVCGMGELYHIDVFAKQAENRFNKKQPFPESISSLNQEQLDMVASEYLKYINSKSNGEIRITDKMPHNFKYVGFIFRLFPNAYVINTVRHPLDTCLAGFFAQYGTHGHSYSYNINDIAKYYLLYEKLMSHWSTVYGDRIHQIKYKDLILDHEASCRKMLAFCDLEWDDECLNFHQSKRKINTLSHEQVSKPIYTGSLDRWKNYEKHIDRLKKRLKPVIANY